jgi:hypothetical protein
LLWVGKAVNKDWRGFKDLFTPGALVVNLADKDVDSINRFLQERRPQTKSGMACLIDWTPDADLPGYLPGWGPRTGTRYFPRALALQRIRSRRGKLAKLTLADAVPVESA